MIIVKLISGLGNQLFQYTIGRQLSLKRKAPLKLDLSFFEDQSLRSYKLNHYNIQADIATKKEVAQMLDIYKSKSLYARTYRKIENSFFKSRKRYFKENEWWIYEKELLQASSPLYVEGYWQHYKYYRDIPEIIFDELTVKEPDTPVVNNYATSIQRDDCSVSLHIRRGDYITDINANNLMGVLPLQYYSQAIKYISEKIAAPSFYIFSDDLNWAKDHLKIQAPVTFIDTGNEPKDYFELDLMSRCRHNIIANSSFSWWGAFLNRHPAKIVVSPARWCVPENINKKIELQFPSWIKM